MKFKYIFYSVLLSIFCFQNSFAQVPIEEETIVEYGVKQSFPYPKYRIGISPSAFMNFFPGIQISNDYGITDRIQLSSETAYIFQSAYGSSANGFRLKIGPEFNVASNRIIRYSIGLHYLHRTTIADREDQIVFREDNYVEHIDFKRKKVVNGLELYSDLSWKLSPRLTLETGVGFGQGNIIVSDSEKNQFREPDELDIIIDGFNWFTGTDRVGKDVYYIMSFNVNISYTIIQ